MTTITLRVTGLDKVQTGFNQFRQTIQPVTNDVTKAALERAEKKSPGYLGGSAYTAPLPKSGDRRTGNLGRTTHIDREGYSMRLQVQAYSKQGYEYSVGVLGDAYGQGQAEWNAGRWVPVRSAVDEQIDLITRSDADIDQAIQRAIRDAGL